MTHPFLQRGTALGVVPQVKGCCVTSLNRHALRRQSNNSARRISYREISF